MKRGFTLMEMILVVVIIGIIAGIALPAYYKAKEKILRNDAFATLKMLQAADKSYYIETGQYFPGWWPVGYEHIPSVGEDFDFYKKLKVSLPYPPKNWRYFCVRMRAEISSICFEAQPVTGATASNTWHLHLDDSGLPQSGYCH